VDIVRPELKRKRRLLRIIYIAAGLVIVALVTVGAFEAQGCRAYRRQEHGLDGCGTRGPMLREVRGLGTLVPENIRVIPAARTAGLSDVCCYRALR